MHFAGAYLYFYGQAVWAVQGGVQGFVAVGLRDGDVVFEFAGLGLVEAVQCAEGGIAGGNAVYDDAKAVYV